MSASRINIKTNRSPRDRCLEDEHGYRKCAAHHVSGQDGRDRLPRGLPASGELYFFREGWNPSGTRFVAFIKDPANNLFEAYSMTADGKDVRYLYHNPSHHSWRDDDHIIDFGKHTPPGGGPPQKGYFLFKDDGSGRAREELCGRGLRRPQQLRSEFRK